MINLEQAKTLIGMPVFIPTGAQFIITKVRQIDSGMILIYNKHGWCCNVEIIRDTNRKKPVFDEVEKLEGDSK